MTTIETASLVLKYLIAIVAVLLIVLVLLQVRSGGLGATFGGSSGGEAYRSKRGVEAVFYNLTILLITIFAVASMVLAAIGA